MKQNEPANPRNLRIEPNAISSHGSTIAAEISGYADIGMKNEALRAVRRLLTRRRILPEEFGEALRTIGIYLSSKTWERWRPILEAAYNRQPRQFKRKVRSEMLSMYACPGEWETALQFVELRKLSNSARRAFRDAGPAGAR